MQAPQRLRHQYLLCVYLWDLGAAYVSANRQTDLAQCPILPGTILRNKTVEPARCLSQRQGCYAWHMRARQTLHSRRLSVC
jgi:hypothetical protein